MINMQKTITDFLYEKLITKFFVIKFKTIHFILIYKKTEKDILTILIIILCMFHFSRFIYFLIQDRDENYSKKRINSTAFIFVIINLHQNLKFLH